MKKLIVLSAISLFVIFYYATKKESASNFYGRIATIINSHSNQCIKEMPLWKRIVSLYTPMWRRHYKLTDGKNCTLFEKRGQLTLYIGLADSLCSEKTKIIGLLYNIINVKVITREWPDRVYINYQAKGKICQSDIASADSLVQELYENEKKISNIFLTLKKEIDSYVTEMDSIGEITQESRDGIIIFEPEFLKLVEELRDTRAMRE